MVKSSTYSKSMGLTSDRSQQILSKKTRDNDNLKVFRDKLSV